MNIRLFLAWIMHMIGHILGILENIFSLLTFRLFIQTKLLQILYTKAVPKIFKSLHWHVSGSLLANKVYMERKDYEKGLE